MTNGGIRSCKPSTAIVLDPPHSLEFLITFHQPFVSSAKKEKRLAPLLIGHVYIGSKKLNMLVWFSSFSLRCMSAHAI
jgi:hypothetical protein